MSQQEITCFLIDDDEDDQEIFSMALADAFPSYKCVTANNCPEAIKMLNADPPFTPDFIFLDLNMPFLSGKECLEKLKKTAHLMHIPVIMYSTSSNEKDIDETKQLGATHFLTKPNSISTLTRFLTDIFQKKVLSYYIGGKL